MSAWCPRCEHWTASPDPAHKAEMYCGRAGCGWDGTKAQAMTPLAKAEARVVELETAATRILNEPIPSHHRLRCDCAECCLAALLVGIAPPASKAKP